MRRFLFALALIFTLVTASCLDIETEISLHKEGSAVLDIEYVIERSTAEFGRGFGSDDPWFLPLTEKDFQLMALRSDGVSLVRYRDSEMRNGSDRIRVRMEADSLESLAKLLEWDMALQRDSNGSRLEIRIPAANPEIGDETRRAVEQLIEGSDFTIRIKPPSRIQSVSESGTIDGRFAEFTTNLDELVFSDENQSWSLTW